MTTIPFVNTNILQAQMKLRGVTSKELAKAQNWCMTTAYRKISGKTAFTAPEIQACVELLSLDSQTAQAIFFTPNLS